MGEALIAHRLLRDVRKQKNVSLGELSYGLCSKSFLSKVENGSQQPDFMLTKALFFRLGMDIPHAIVPVTKSERLRYNIESEITTSLATSNYNIKQLLNEYATCSNKMNKLETQFHAAYTALSIKPDEKLCNAKKRKAGLISALKLTQKDFTGLQSLYGKLFSRVELILLNNIARTEHELYRITKNVEYRENAINMMKFLIEYDDKVFSEHTSMRLCCLYIFNLTNWLDEPDCTVSALRYAEFGIFESKQKKSIEYYIYQTFNKGYFLAKLGRTKEAIPLLCASFLWMENNGKSNDVDYGLSELKRLFNLDLYNVVPIPRILKNSRKK